MLSRCEDSDNPQFKDYGGRGITVCEEWHSYQIFYEWCENNGFEDGLFLDRTDNDLGYSPENCEFVTRVANNNNKRNTVRLTVWGETKTLSEWVLDPRCVVQMRTVKARYHRGWTHEDILSVPVKSRRAYKGKAGAPAYTLNGETKTLKAWIDDERCVVKNYSTVFARIKDGWSLERALTTPARKMKKHDE
jgi:hypothetical protein